MNRKSLSVLVIVLGVALVLLLRDLAPVNAQEKVAVEEVKRFGNGILMLCMVTQAGLESSENSQLLEDATLVTIGDKYFVQGTGYVAKRNADDERYQWYDGINVAYAMDTVSQYVLFTSKGLDDYLTAIEKAGGDE